MELYKRLARPRATRLPIHINTADQGKYQQQGEIGTHKHLPTLLPFCVKRLWHEIFYFRFLPRASSPGPLTANSILLRPFFENFRWYSHWRLFTVVNNTRDKLVSTTQKKNFSTGIVNNGIYTLARAFILIASVVSLMPGDKLKRFIIKSKNIFVMQSNHTGCRETHVVQQTGGGSFRRT
jgi:hypothetical protein